MSADVLIFSGSFKTQMSLPFFDGGIQAGLPHDTQDFPAEPLDFNKDFVRHPDATFYARVDTDGMQAVGIGRGDLAVIDRAEDPADGDVVVVFVDGDFRIGTLDLSGAGQGMARVYQPSGNDSYLMPAGELEVWGVVVWTMRRRTR